MIKVKEILEHGEACPYQLNALTECGKEIYLRYRRGWLAWGFIEKWQVIPEPYIFRQKIGDDYDGFADDESFKKALAESLVFPPDFRFESYPEENK
jgi:hypothetical protein